MNTFRRSYCFLSFASLLLWILIASFLFISYGIAGLIFVLIITLFVRVPRYYFCGACGTKFLGAKLVYLDGALRIAWGANPPSSSTMH